MYATKPSRLDILNETAPQFFWIVQQLLWSEALLGICRLTAHPKSYNKPNLTVRRLAPLIESDELRVEVESKVETVVKDARFANDWRNRRIAHRDLALALGHPAEPLATATKEAVDICFTGLANVLNAVQLHYTNGTTAYNCIISQGGAHAILYYLRDGLRREEDRQASLDGGKYDPRLWNDDLGDL
ncbi:MAG: hypothetical protein ABJF88_11395 [Rhodothermales bacterium]